jgi:hypothetical protein
MRTPCCDLACPLSQAMRQDLTVQHLRNELAVRIYQAHARAALEYGDSAEYNQCQTQLNVLAVEVSCLSMTGCNQHFTPLSIEHLLTADHKQGIKQHWQTNSQLVLCRVCQARRPRSS